MRVLRLVCSAVGPRACSISILLTACAAHEDGPEPASPSLAPAIIQEAVPTPPPPAIVAPPLAELAPTRPLANLHPLWQRVELGEGPPPSTVWPVGATPVAMTPDDAAALGLAGPPGELSRVGASTPWALAAAGPLLLFDEQPEFTALDRIKNEVRWTTQRVEDGRSYASFVSPRVLVAQFYTPSADRLIAWALEDGRRVWARNGESDGGFERIKALWTDGVRGYFVGDGGLVAFDPVTGAMIWSTSLADPSCGAASGEGVVVIEDPAGHRVLDAADGRELPGFAAGEGAGRCAWASYAWDGVAPAVIDSGRLYAFDSQTRDPPSPLRAFDLASRAELWTATGFGDDLLVADHDAVFVVLDERALIGLDASSGVERTRISIGRPFEASVEPVGGDAGPLIVIDDEDAGTWILGRGETAVTPEAYELRGRLVATEGLAKRRLSGVRLRVGEQIVKTDRRGGFVAQGEAQGALVVEQADEYGHYDPNEWTQVVVDPRRIVLDGSGRYELGEVPAYEVSME